MKVFIFLSTAGGLTAAPLILLFQEVNCKRSGDCLLAFVSSCYLGDLSKLKGHRAWWLVSFWSCVCFLFLYCDLKKRQETSCLPALKWCAFVCERQSRELKPSQGTSFERRRLKKELGHFWLLPSGPLLSKITLECISHVRLEQEYTLPKAKILCSWVLPGSLNIPNARTKSSFHEIAQHFCMSLTGVQSTSRWFPFFHKSLINPLFLPLSTPPPSKIYSLKMQKNNWCKF